MLEFGGKVIDVDPWSQGDFTDGMRRPVSDGMRYAPKD
jgi:hypothetical protein